MPSVVSDIRKRLLAQSSAQDQNLEGASDEEIEELEKYAGGRLPSAYKQFLKQFGRSAGELFRGTEYSVSQRFRLRLKEHAQRILRRCDAPFVLPNIAFVFLMAPGSQFAYFEMDHGDDPSVYYYREGYAAPKQLDTTLSGYLLQCIEEYEHRNHGRSFG